MDGSPAARTAKQQQKNSGLGYKLEYLDVMSSPCKQTAHCMEMALDQSINL